MIPARLWREIDEAIGELRVWSRGELALTDAPQRLAARLAELPHEYRRSHSLMLHELRAAAAHGAGAAAPERAVTTFVDTGRFEAAFRGTEDEIAARYVDVAERFAGHAPVLDVGAGRGEFLALLAERGIAARGVELDTGLVAEARERGFDVDAADGARHLGALPPASLGGVVALQVVEHLDPGALASFARGAARAVRPGGLVFVDTPNLRTLGVLAGAFYADPTHRAPLHPEYLAELFTSAGFAEVMHEERGAVPPTPEIPGVDAASGARLARLLFGPPDRAITAIR